MSIKLKDSHLDLSKVRVVSESKRDVIQNETLKKGLKLSITNDLMFKMMFLREEYIKFPCYLLSYIIDDTYENILNNAHFTKNETGKENKNSYEYRNDLVLNIDEAKIVVEMNNNSSEKIRNRNVSYMMRVREDRKEKDIYHQTILVNLNNYRYKEDEKIRRDFAFLDEEGYVYTDSLIIIDIYLPNIIRKCYTEGKESLSEMERFLLIGITQDYKSALEYVGDDIVMKEFVEESMEKSNDEGLLRAYDHREADIEQGYRYGYYEGKEIGIEEGREEGRKEEKIEIAKKFLEEKVDSHIISKVTGLSVEKLRRL